MESNIGQGFTLLLIGMATVYGFLWFMILIMNGTAAFFQKFAHLFPEEQAAAPSKKPTTTSDPAAEIAVALAAIKAKRG